MNVVLAIADTLRSDFLGYNGNGWISTPRLDRLAAQSIVFDRFYVGNFPSLPARMDLLTGRETIAYASGPPLPGDDALLPDILREAGYTTTLVTDHPSFFTNGVDLSRGYQAWRWIRGQLGDRWRTAPRHVNLPCAPEKILRTPEYLRDYLRNVADRRGEEDFFAAQIALEAGRWLEENLDNQPFFLHLEFLDPHEPFDPPQHYVESYDPGYSEDAVMLPRYESWADFMSERELEHTRSLYAGEVTLVDTWFGHVLDRLDALGLADNTLVIFASDHGYYFGERGWIGKSRFVRNIGHPLPLYEELAHIPLIIRAPGASGQRVDGLCQLADLAPTILDFAGIAPVPTHQGHSLRHLIEGDADCHRSFVLSGSPVYRRGRYAPVTITTEEWSFIHVGEVTVPEQAVYTKTMNGIDLFYAPPDPVPGPELFHLPSDPAQARNRLGSDREVAEDLVRRYTAHLRERGVKKDVLKLRAGLEPSAGTLRDGKRAGAAINEGGDG